MYWGDGCCGQSASSGRRLGVCLPGSVRPLAVIRRVRMDQWVNAGVDWAIGAFAIVTPTHHHLESTLSAARTVHLLVDFLFS
jgi:hypothetical protein